MSETVATALSPEPEEQQKQLHLDRRRFHALLQAHSAVTWSTDPQGYFIEPQPGWQNYTGQSWDECRGHGGFAALHPEDREAIRQRWAEVIQTKEPYDAELRIWHAASTSWHWCACRGVPVLDQAGQICEWIGTLVDIDTRKRAELALYESERRFRGILERVQAIGLMVDITGRVTFINDFALQLTGWSREEVVGRDFFSVFIQGTSDIEARFRAAVSNGDIFPHGENDVVTRSGQRCTIAWDNIPVRDLEGKLIGTASIGRDVTEQRQLVGRLQASESRLRTLVEAMPQLAWSTDATGFCDYLSPQWLEFTGASAAESYGQGWTQSVHPDDRPRVEQIWESFIAGLQAYDTEYRLRRHDGAYRWFKARAASVLDAHGNVLSIFGTSTDIHDQKLAEEALKKNQERLRVALSASGTGTFRWDPQTGRFLEFDDSLREIFGFSPGEPVETTGSFLERVHPDDVRMVVEQVEHCKQGADFELEYRIVLPGGEVRWLYDRARMIKDEGGQALYLVGACTDITPRKRVEEALLRSEKLAVAGSVAATLAHEINNPLEALLNLIYLSKLPGMDESKRLEILAAAEREITRAAELSKRSLRFYRGSNSGTTASLQKVLDSVLFVYGPKLQQRNITFTADYRVDASLNVPESELRQVFYNLVSNSADAMTSGGTLVLRVGQLHGGENPGRVAVSVADTGTGIEHQHRSRLFRPFFTTKDDVGTGLGLWVSREIIERYNGRIRFRTRCEADAHGTVFTVAFPATAIVRS